MNTTGTSHSTNRLKATVITVSDSSFKGTRKDLSGPAVAVALESHGFEVVGIQIVPDEIEDIQDAISESCEQSVLVVTTGGTGIAARDVTPEATRAICDRLIEGIPEQMRRESAKKTPQAALSRGLCGTLGHCLVLNLPGSPKGAVEALQSVISLLPHALQLLAGHTAHNHTEPGE
ncbi:MAG TPA: MogA/MoaB family molybdenum cofactor biosynthesis protein [candidate division Zixibacteria bacterium]|nr:MogA/MoaB family molybdenum cofactor biosynthesis protein [candidate division Zixibacteria bacterium]